VATTAAENPNREPQLQGLLLELDSPGALLTASEQVRDAGYTKWDTHTPFPVHGIDEAMGIRRTRLPWIVFLLGCGGFVGGLLLQWWTNAVSADQFTFVPNFLQGYNYWISGKPDFSFPANIPVIFETTVLAAALAAVFGMLLMNNLPWHHNPLLASERFRRVTADRFFIVIDAKDPQFDETKTAGLLQSLGGTAVEPIRDLPDSPTKFPRALVIGGMIVVCLLLFPPLIVANMRSSLKEEPRIHLIQDMDNQPRYKAQQFNPVFADGRAQRQPVAGTVARGDFPTDAHFRTGRLDGDWTTAFPPRVTIDEDLLRRGQQRFMIYCAPCHGYGGAGDGIVHQRAIKLNTAGWVVPTSMLSDNVRERAHGHIFNTITNGIRSMPPYGDQIAPQDRWAIVAYIRALQFSQYAPTEDVPQKLLPAAE
jgi:mono/diheme cytochrome c family protein